MRLSVALDQFSANGHTEIIAKERLWPGKHSLAQSVVCSRFVDDVSCRLCVFVCVGGGLDVTFSCTCKMCAFEHVICVFMCTILHIRSIRSFDGYREVRVQQPAVCFAILCDQ